MGGDNISDEIVKVVGREILNAQGYPTVEAEVITTSGIRAIASVPSGTSKGKYEAYELYDNEKRYSGFGVKKAANNVTTIINDALCGMDVIDQLKIDNVMQELDGTINKEHLGVNAIMAVSVAIARAGALVSGMPLYRYLAEGKEGGELPNIVATVIAGGAYSTSGLEFEDYMYILDGFDDFADSLEALSDMRRLLEKNLRKKYGDFLEDGGALAAPLSSTIEAFEEMLQSAKEVGCEKLITLGLDVAGNELFDVKTRKYKIRNCIMEKESLIKYYVELCKYYPLTFIEDGFEQDDFDGFAMLKRKLPNIQIVGDDLFVTNVERLKVGIQKNCANTLLLKINQIGTVSEAIAANNLARENHYDVAVSLRSGETTDDFIADLSVALRARQIKLGSPVRAERNAKYNRLLKIEQELNS